jgi:hypothetical protein
MSLGGKEEEFFDRMNRMDRIKRGDMGERRPGS